nr:MAG TPA: hypothetical protein [Caudoviricetes sp.]
MEQIIILFIPRVFRSSLRGARFPKRKKRAG